MKYEILFTDRHTEIVDHETMENLVYELESFERTDVSQIHEYDESNPDEVGKTIWTEEEGLFVSYGELDYEDDDEDDEHEEHEGHQGHRGIAHEPGGDRVTCPDQVDEPSDGSTEDIPEFPCHVEGEVVSITEGIVGVAHHVTGDSIPVDPVGERFVDFNHL